MTRWVLGVLALAMTAGPSWAGPPAAVAPASAEQARAERSFDQFARRWMEKMERAEANNRAEARPRKQGQSWQVEYRGYGGALRTRLRPTGYPKAPFVGVLEYAEERMVCDTDRAARCRVAGSMPVTEIFRYQGGRWVY